MSLKHTLISLFQIAFAIGFAVILIMAACLPVLFANTGNLARLILSLIVLALLILFLFAAFYRWLDRFVACGQKIIAAVLFGMIGIFELILIFKFHTISPPLIDGGHTYVEALYLLRHHHASGAAYFQIYPNNIPVTLLRYLLYRIFAIFHFQSYMIIDRLFCGGALFAGIYFLWKFIIRQFNLRSGNLFLAMALTSFPYFFYTLYFYTDTAIIMIPPLLILLWQKYSRTHRLRELILLGIALGLGCQIRQNLILFLPAVIIYWLVKAGWRKTILPFFVICGLLITCQMAMQQVERAYGYQPNPRLAMPTSHWLMLGLSADGGYNKADYKRTVREPTQEAKRATNWQVIRERMDRAGAGGLITLWGLKIARTWGMGAEGYYWYTEFTSHPSLAYTYLFGDRRVLVLFTIQAFYLVSLFLTLFSVVRFFRTRELTTNLLIQICLFGNLLFYTFIWEAEPRYSLLFSPYFLLSAVFGFHELRHQATHLRTILQHNDPSEKRLQALKQWSSFSLLVLVLIFGELNQQDVTENRIVRDYRVNLPHVLGKESAKVDATHQIGQTFQASKSFNRIRIAVKSKNGHGRYLITLRTPGNMQKLITTTDRLKSKHSLVLRVPLQQLPAGTSAQLNIQQLSGSPGASLHLKMNGRGFDLRDIYPHGTMTRNGRPVAKSDLQFQVYYQHMAPLIPETLYDLLLIIPEVLILITAASLAMESIRRPNGSLRSLLLKRKTNHQD